MGVVPKSKATSRRGVIRDLGYSSTVSDTLSLCKVLLPYHVLLLYDAVLSYHSLLPYMC